MKIAILGANGQLGRLLVNEGLKRGYSVTSIMRRATKIAYHPPHYLLCKEVQDITQEEINQFDIVISALGVWDTQKTDAFLQAHEHILNLLTNTTIRYIVVGGMGSLYTNNDKNIMVVDSNNFPQEWVPVATANKLAYQKIVSRQDVQWTFFSPAYNFDVNGVLSNGYIYGDDILLYNQNNQSYLSYLDGVQIVYDEIINKKYLQKRFTACKK